MHLKRLILASCTIVLAALTAPAAFAQQNAPLPTVSIIANERKDAPAAITFGSGAFYKASDAAKVFGIYLPVNAATDELRFKASDKASANINVARYTQFYKGIKVEHGSYIIASKNEVMSYMSGNFYKTDYAINTNPGLNEATALQKALDHTGAKKYIWEVPGADEQLKRDLNDPSASYAPKGTLVLIEDYFSGEQPDGILHLAWHFDVYATAPLSRNDVYVDAASGRILFTNSIIKHVAATGSSVYSGPVTFEANLTSGTYSLHDATRGGGVNTYSLRDSTGVQYAQDVTSTSNAFATNVALDAHWGAEKVYDYWSTQRSRLSYNNANAPLNSYVDYSRGYNNAFWSGTAMFYGNGTGRSSGFDPLVSLDICGHEIGHGVCQETAGLIYNRESGGMNEGFSDIWGAVIENYANPHETDATAKDRWKIGEEIAANPLRDMSNPTFYGDPDTYGGAHWKWATSNCSPSSNNNDQCGVHSNSGVLNKWFYFLTEGGSGMNGVGNYYAVPGIGMDTAAQIAYGTELSLTQTSNYNAARIASINYATLQYGACSKVVEAVTRAWYAVNVGADYTSCTPQISFAAPVSPVTENAASADCPGSHIVSIPVIINGPAPTGGDAVITVSVTGGTAVNGIDYTIPTTMLTFPAGSTAPQQLSINILDNANTLDTGKYIDLAFTMAANGSTALPANVLTTTRVKITNDDAAPVLGITETRTIGSNDVASNNTSPFQSIANQAHVQYIVTAQELLAGGLKPNATLTKIAFTVTSKVSTLPYTDFTVKLAPTTTQVFTTGFLTPAFTTVYSGNWTTSLGINTIPFSNNYVWDGTSNIAVEICFGNTARATGNDQVQGTSAAGNRIAFATNNNTTGGCGINFIAANVATVRPVIRFTQIVDPSPIEAAAGATRKWAIRAGDRAYFYSDSDKELIAGIFNGVNDLGCVDAKVTAAGNGFVPVTAFAPFSTANRSIKEWSIQPTTGADTSGYEGLFYLTNDELGTANSAMLQILKTTAATDADITPANTQVVPVITRTTGLTYKGFRAAFSGFGRYFFVDGTPNLAVGTIAQAGNDLRVVNNPFQDELKIAWNLQRSESADIKLLDVTGKLLYSGKQALTQGNGQASVKGISVLPAGNYILQVVRPGSVFTAKVLKN